MPRPHLALVSLAPGSRHRRRRGTMVTTREIVECAAWVLLFLAVLLLGCVRGASEPAVPVDPPSAGTATSRGVVPSPLAGGRT